MTKKNCFVICPIGETGSETRKRADQILKHIIEPAVEKCGYKAIRADKISEPGLITSHVVQHVVDDPLVIADLTDSNPNVFYELALRHTIRKPFIQIIQKGEKIPFDIAGMRTIQVDHRDLDSVDEALNEIVKQIRATEDKPPSQIDSPISVSIELQALRQSDNPEQRSLAELVTAVSDLRVAFTSLESRLFERKEPNNLVVSGGGMRGQYSFKELVELNRSFEEKKAKQTEEEFALLLKLLSERKGGGTSSDSSREDQGKAG